MLRVLATYLLLTSALSAQSVEIEGKDIRYTVSGPYAVVEGDIIIGRANEIEEYAAKWRAGMRGQAALAPASLSQSFGATGTQPWADATMYYMIDSDVPDQQRILDGIAHWNTRTQFKILPRTSERNYVRFRRVMVDAACYSYLGMIGGEQEIGTTDSCSAGSVIHELGHAWGLWHEHQRSDRGGNLTVLYDNIDKRYYSDFNQSLTGSRDLSYYDFGSIMHYGPTGFSRNYQDTLATVPPGIPFGQRTALSTGDIDGVTRLYKLMPAGTTIATTPTGLNMTVDGAVVTSPQTFNWASGSSHTVSVETIQGVDPRYVFARWSDDGAATHTITASPNLTAICANFVVQHKVQAGVASGQGTVSLLPASPDGYFGERYPFTVSATPEAGSRLIRWTGSTYLQSVGQSISASPARVLMQGGPSSYQATFTTGPVTTIDSKPRGALITVDGLALLTPANLAWTAGSTHALSYTNPQLFGNNTNRLQFMSWEDGTTGPRTVTAGADSAIYTATFNAQYRLSTSVLGSGSVTASPSASDGYYDADTTVQLTAAGNNGTSLRYWLGDIAGGASPANVVMNQQRDVTAVIGTPLSFRVLSSASFQGNPVSGNSASLVAPGEIVAIFGTGIGPDVAAFGAVGSDGKLPFSLGGTSVLFDSFPAPIIYASKDQINVVVPYGVAGQTSSTVRITGRTTFSTTVQVGASAPALFTYDGSGTGQLAALNPDFTVNSPVRPAAPGSIVVLYGTGAGVFNKAFADGQILATDLGTPRAGVWVRFGKLQGEILYVGTAPFLVNGALQVNVRIPADLAGGGAVPVQLIVGAYTSPPGTTISVAGQ
jgi:uncharacterized protein (TIGR03437 family)